MATATIADGAHSGSTVSFTTGSLTAGTFLQMDTTAIGSGTPGSSVSAVLEATQP